MSDTALKKLQLLFADKPNVLLFLDLRELDENNLTDQKLAEELKKKKLYPEPVNLYSTGRTGAGKTSLGNSLLDAGKESMVSHGGQDCTREVQFFAMASNLRYFDLPGAGSNENFENINRAALLISQIDDEDEGITPISEFPVWDFSDYPNTKQIHKEIYTVAQWQSAENQKYVGADLVLYVVAPDKQFLRDDRKYLTALLKSQKERSKNNKVIFALNIHRNKDGTEKPTLQNIQDTRRIITEIYQKFYSDEPPIVEIDSLRGTGINKITELMCQILPSNKMSNMQQALRDELKHFAKQERSRRYRQALIYIASRLATFKVDENFGDKSLLQEAYAAICDYGIRIFFEEDARAKAEKELYEMVDALAAQSKISREEALKIMVKDVEEKEVTTNEIVGYMPEYKDVNVTEEIPEYYESTEKVRRSTIARAGLGFAEGIAQIATSPISFIQSIGSAFGLVDEKDIVGNKIHESFDRDSYRNENVMKSKTKTRTRTEQRFSGMKEMRKDVTRTVQSVIEKEQEIGTKYLQGGYPVIENLLAIGLGIETADPSQDLRIGLDAVIKSGRTQVQAILSRYKDQINQLVESSPPDQAEDVIIGILEKVLIS